MVISSALLLARCCCIFMLLLSFANVAKYTNTAVASATAPRSSNASATPSNDPNENEESDPCFLNQVAPKDGWTRKTTRSEGLCEYHLNFDLLDHEHLIQLNLSLGPVSEMTSGHQQKLQERRTTSTHIITSAGLNRTGNPFKHAPKTHVNNDNTNYDNDNYDNFNDRYGPESSLSSREGTSNASKHSQRLLDSHTTETNRTSDSGPTGKSAIYRQPDGDHSPFDTFPSGHPDNASQSEIIDNNNNSSKDVDIRTGNVDRKKVAGSSPTLKGNWSDSGGNQEASSFCLLTLVVQGPDEKQPQKRCIQDVSHHNLIYYLHNVLNVTITWDRRFVSDVHLTYAMVPTKGVKCRINCGKNLCVLESGPCENTPNCSDASNEKRKECAESRPSPQSQHEQSTGNIILIVMGVVLVILVVCCCLLMRRNRCQLSRDALLRQQQRPHSHSSEMYPSPSGIMQDTRGQYDARMALLPDRHQQASSSHNAHPSSQAQSSPNPGITNSHQQQPSVSLPSHPHHAPLSPYFQPPQSSLLPCNGNNRQGHCTYMFQTMSKPTRSPHHTYPHQIAMSKDGEEGFKASQQALHSTHHQHQNFLAQTEVFRPPPNKTVFDRGSPPPPYSFKAPSGSKSPDLLVQGMSGINLPRLVCSGSSNNNVIINNNSNKHNNNNNMDKCKNQGSAPPLSAPAGSQIFCPPSPANIHLPNHLSTSGPPPDYHQVAATHPQSKHNLSDLPVPLPSRQGAPPPGPTSLPSPEGPFSPTRSSPIFCGFSPMEDGSNTFVVTKGSPSVCPGPVRSTTTHRSPGSENGGGNGTESAQAICAPPTSWSSMTTVPSSQSSALSIETPLLTSSPAITSSSSHSLHVPVLLNLSLPSSSMSFSHGVDSGLLCASAITIATPALERQAPGHNFNNNDNNITINNINDNNIDDNHHHNNFTMNKLATGHCNNNMVNNNSSNNNNNDSYCNNNNNNSNDLECVANNCGVSSNDSPRLTPSKALLLVPTTLASSPSHVSTHLAFITTMPFSSLSSLSPHHQHLPTHRHCPIHIQPTRQPQPPWQEASQGVTFNPTSVQRSTSRPPQSSCPPSAVTNAEYDHATQARNGTVLCSESNGNVFLGHEPLLSTLATSPAVVSGVLDPNGNNSEGQMVKDSRGLPSSSSSSSSSQGCPDVAILDPNENCDWSKSIEALSISPVVSSSVDPHMDSSPCCDNISAATTTKTTTASSPSSTSPSSPMPSSSSTFVVLPPRNVDPEPTDSGAGDTTANNADKNGRQVQKENATTAASQEEEQDVVEVVVVTKSRHSPTCTAAQERLE